MSQIQDIEDLNEEDIDEDEILAMLSPEELQELQSEMDVIIAPDENVPVGQRQKDQTEKTPTGSFDHRSLVDYLYWEKESNRMLEEERVPATLLPSEKVLREEAAKKEQEETTDNRDIVYEVIEEVITEEEVDGYGTEEIVEEIIEEIVEEEVEETCQENNEAENTVIATEQADATTDLSKEEEETSSDDNIEKIEDEIRPTDEAKIQTEISNSEKTREETPEEVKGAESPPPADEVKESTYKPPPKEKIKINKLKIPQLALGNIKMTSRPSGNETNLDSTLNKIRNNHPSVTEVNLNNIENIPKEMLLDYVNALKKNKHVSTFSVANTGVDENTAFLIANMLRENRSITTLNIESNFITGKGIVAIIRCLQFNETLTELRFHNQRHMLGHHSEMEISRLLKANNTLLKMGYHFEQAGPRMVVTNILTRNLDRQRQQRKEEQRQQQLKEQKDVLQMYENSLNLPPGLLQMLGYPIEVLQEHGVIPPLEAITESNVQLENGPQKKLNKHNNISNARQEPAQKGNPLKDVQLKRTPKKRDPFLDIDPRERSDTARASFQLKRTSRGQDTAGQDVTEGGPNLGAVIKTLKPVSRRRLPPKVDVTPRDMLLNQIKQSNVAYLKAVPLPKELESSETSLI
ncbi:leiomodin-3 [Eucyclogobius newberryi]|uniref:leiomodin-3 n=1 Tax=Eucyclogobius newberryi TaxID=166745 RepID=UPI003B5BF603